MKLRISEQNVEFFSGGVSAGRYNLNDPFKPFLHPLHTPAGRMVSAASPHDHRHHKGLMYALQTVQFNFWEEVPASSAERIGRQRPLGFENVDSAGDEIGFTQQLAWESADGAAPVFHEDRTIRCRHEGDEFVWTWSARLTVSHACRLIKGRGSCALPDGRRISYNGLGLRLARSFGCTGNNALLLDGRKVSFREGMGQVPRRATFQGTFDPLWPEWPGPRAAITFEQEQNNGLFVMESPFAYMAMGPSNLEEVELLAGQILAPTYRIRVADIVA
jgi:hypothetical protein